MLDEVAGLESLGHSVAHFAAAHPDNEPSPFDHHFSPYIELSGGADLGVVNSARAAWRMFANRPARRGLGELLSEFKPDLVHIHGIHRQISPSILYLARDRQIPVIQTLHDYHHVCPSDNLQRAGMTPCMPPLCSPLNYGAAIRYSCLDGSRSRSTLSALETWFQRARKAYERTVDRFIAPSAFMAEAMKAGGWEIETDLIPNAAPVSERARCEPEGEQYVLYAGRLAKEKGVDVALAAASKAGVRMIVAGDGPMGEQLRKRYPEADFLGFVSGDRVETLLAGARAAVVPSLWHENASMSVLEAMAQGVPLVSTRMGGIPEQVDDGVEGILCDPGDVDQMAAAFSRLLHDEKTALAMGTAGRKRIAEEFSPERHMDLLLASYERVLMSA